MSTRRHRLSRAAGVIALLVAASVGLSSGQANAFATPMTSPRQVAITSFAGLTMAWIGTDANNTLNVAQSGDGIHFGHSIQPFGRGNSRNAPALTFYDGHLYIAWTGTDANQTLNLASSADGVHFTGAAQPLGRNNSDDGPALAAFGTRLYYAWKGTDSHHTLNIASTADGVHFTNPIQPNRYSSINAPAIATYNGKLYMAWAGTDFFHLINLASSTDGITFTQVPLRAFGTNHQPSLSEHDALPPSLDIDFTGTDVNHHLNIITYSGDPSVVPFSLIGPIVEAPAVSGIFHAFIDQNQVINTCVNLTC